MLINLKREEMDAEAKSSSQIDSGCNLDVKVKFEIELLQEKLRRFLRMYRQITVGKKLMRNLDVGQSD